MIGEHGCLSHTKMVISEMFTATNIKLGICGDLVIICDVLKYPSPLDFVYLVTNHCVQL